MSGEVCTCKQNPDGSMAAVPQAPVLFICPAAVSSIWK
ncbi:hypothetical protein BRCON_1911 [Candidatus Sumerlaea chitinivorans]|uniref:Uncharacterized protein n=1 Tax=Sumerlaea chitinivorans TaxID=2250252 RepID=A0A2Z4Y783_SUMC1|nr:hypothetical protein BRCON_1911 [Candidatus Sumerlaea chitinivorans]